MLLELSGQIYDILTGEIHPFTHKVDQNGINEIDFNYESNNFTCREDLEEVYVNHGNILQICESGIYLNANKICNRPESWIVNTPKWNPTDGKHVSFLLSVKNVNVTYYLMTNKVIDELESNYNGKLLPYMLSRINKVFYIRNFNDLTKKCEIVRQKKFKNYEIIHLSVYDIDFTLIFNNKLFIAGTMSHVKKITEVVALTHGNALVVSDKKYYIMSEHQLIEVSVESYNLIKNNI